jgi:hypothetical protein
MYEIAVVVTLTVKAITGTSVDPGEGDRDGIGRGVSKTCRWQRQVDYE